MYIVNTPGPPIPVRGQEERALGHGRGARRVRVRGGARVLAARQAGEHAHPVVSAAHRQPAQQLGRPVRYVDTALHLA